MDLNRFEELKAEFEPAAQRLKEAKDLDKRQSVLRDIHKIVAEFDQLMQQAQRDLLRRKLEQEPRD